MLKDRYTIIQNSIDYSNDLWNFTSRDATISFLAGEYIYVGYRKPISNVYVEVTTPAISESNLFVEAYDGTNWYQINTTQDDTYGFSKSGMIQWVENDHNTKVEKTTIDGQTMYFYRVSLDADITATFRAFGVLFSNDNDIFVDSPILDNARYRNHVVGTDDSYLRLHVSSRDYIIQQLRNAGIKKYNSVDDNRLQFFRHINEFDFFDIDEVRQASKFLTLSSIYYKLSDSPDDKWQFEASRYRMEYEKALDIAFISIDRDDDGRLESNENLRSSECITIKR